MHPIPDIPYGPYLLRIRPKGKGFAGIIVGHAKDIVTGATAEEVESLLRDKAASMNKGFIGLAGARTRFKEAFPEGFSDSAYLASGDYGERGYKLDHHKRVCAEMPVDQALNKSVDPETALRLFRALNLADPFTKARMTDTLRSDKAQRFLEIVAMFAKGDIASSCRLMNSEFASEKVNTWVCLTFFPFFWQPDVHLFLKPAFTKDFAERIGDEFQFEYESAPNLETYTALLHMANRTSQFLDDMNPRDYIDIHSFMFVTVEYTDENIKELTDYRLTLQG